MVARIVMILDHHSIVPIATLADHLSARSLFYTAPEVGWKCARDLNLQISLNFKIGAR